MKPTERLIKTCSKTEKRFRKRAKTKKYPLLERVGKKEKYVNTKQVLERLNYRGIPSNELLFTDRISIERTIGTNDLLNINYLKKGIDAARPVGRITSVTDEGRFFGTGFLIGTNIFITNNHVIASKTEARNSYVEFNYEEDKNDRPINPITFDFDPNKLFITSVNLDFTILYVKNASYDGAHDLSEFGSLKLIERTGKLQEGEMVSIIQHPKGQRKQVALRNNEVTDIFDQFIHYVTDTEPGSSGITCVQQ